MIAAEYGNIERMRNLLSRGVSVNVVDSNGWTPLRRAVYNLQTEAVRFLLDQGALINLQSPITGMTALLYASDALDDQIVPLLLNAGADPNIQSISGWTPLMRASLYGDTQIVSLLLDTGADPNLQDEDGNTALSNALDEGHIWVVRLLAMYGATE